MNLWSCLMREVRRLRNKALWLQGLQELDRFAYEVWVEEEGLEYGEGKERFSLLYIGIYSSLREWAETIYSSCFGQALNQLPDWLRCSIDWDKAGASASADFHIIRKDSYTIVFKRAV